MNLYIYKYIHANYTIGKLKFAYLYISSTKPNTSIIPNAETELFCLQQPNPTLGQPNSSPSGQPWHTESSCKYKYTIL